MKCHKFLDLLTGENVKIEEQLELFLWTEISEEMTTCYTDTHDQQGMNLSVCDDRIHPAIK